MYTYEAMSQGVKNLPAIQETQVKSLGGEDPLENGTATRSSILSRRIPWRVEPGGLQSMGSPRVKYQLSDRDYIYDLHTFPSSSIHNSQDKETI